MDIIQEIDQILKDRNIQSQDVTGFDDNENHEYYYFDLSSKDRKMGIDVCRECTIYLGDWHGHYNPETEWDEFLKTLNGIFDNELCSLSAYIGSPEAQNAGTSMLARSEDVNEEYIIDELGTEKIVRSCFFDSSQNKEYRV